MFDEREEEREQGGVGRAMVRISECGGDRNQGVEEVLCRDAEGTRSWGTGVSGLEMLDDPPRGTGSRD